MMPYKLCKNISLINGHIALGILSQIIHLQILLQENLVL